MSNKLSALLKKVFLGSLAGIAANNQSNAGEIASLSHLDNDKNTTTSLLESKKDLSLKLLLKKASTEEWEFTSHRSHRSHSSHRSHYSSYSGGGSSSYTPSRSSSGSSSSSNSGSSSSSLGFSSGTNSPSKAQVYNTRISTAVRLGTRVLKKGMKGTDVTELINILLKKSYLVLESGQTQVTGSYDYDTVVERAVKEFQTDNRLKSDGICGYLTIYYLKNL